MDFNTFLSYIIVFILGYNLGEYIMRFRLRAVLKKIDNIEEPNKTNVRALIIDQVDKMLYLRDHDTGSFVCQAETLSDLAKLALSYKKIEYAAVWYDDKFVFFVKGNVKFNMIQIARQLDEG